jgi:hypothetical protein
MSNMYSQHLDFAPTFKWGGRSWGANDLTAFQQALQKKKIPYSRWANNHRTAARAFDPVEQYVYGAIQPQISAIERERGLAASANQRRLHDYAGFTQAIMGMLGQISPAVQGAYNQGANTMQAGGTGYGDVLNTNLAANAAKGNSVLDVLGSDQRLSGGDAGGVLAGLAGWLPSEMMKGQGAGAATELNALPQEASFQAQMQARQLMAEDREQQEGFSHDILGILQGLPAARQQIQDMFTARADAAADRRAQDHKGRLAALEADRDFWLRRQALALQKGDAKLARDAENRLKQAQTRLDYESAGRDFEGNPMPGYVVNPKTGTLIPPGYKVDKGGNVVKDSSSSSGGKKPKYTPIQKRAMIEKIMQKEDDIKSEIIHAVSTDTWQIPPPGSKPRSGGGRKQRVLLADRLFKKYVHLAGTPTARKALRTLIGRLLSEAESGSLVPPGGSGGSDVPSWQDSLSPPVLY